MGTNHLNRLVGCYEQIFNELYMADTIVNITRNSCLDREFSGQYYGIHAESSAPIKCRKK